MTDLTPCSTTTSATPPTPVRPILLLLALVLPLAACDLIDGTQARNPDLTLEEAVSGAGSAEAWLNGLNHRHAVLTNELLVLAELTSDNYVNENTFFNTAVQNGVFNDTDTDVNNVQKEIARLREQAQYGLDVILVENDPDAAGTEIEAGYHFWIGWSHLLAGDYFTGLPAESAGEVLAPETHYTRAVTAFEEANRVAANPSFELALARAHYSLGNRSEATTHAQALLQADPDYLRVQEFDGVNGPTSSMEAAVYDRQSFNDLQPLPRLDFLDPKYGDLGGTEESPVILQSAEEAWLILIEAALSQDDLPLATDRMEDLLDLVDSREIREFNESGEPRMGASANVQRPNSSDVIVRASASDPFVAGLVLDRVEETPVPVVSGTSVTRTQIANLTDSDGDALETLYLLRQEVLFGEGRRMADLGVRWPVSREEADNNENVTTAHRQPVIPEWLPATYSAINAWSREGDEVTIQVNLNRELVQGRGNRFDP
ncbi:MAG: hypothetical protein WD115_03010 [Balneolaceae bacterium]